MAVLSTVKLGSMAVCANFIGANAYDTSVPLSNAMQQQQQLQNIEGKTAAWKLKQKQVTEWVNTNYYSCRQMGLTPEEAMQKCSLLNSKSSEDVKGHFKAEWVKMMKGAPANDVCCSADAKMCTGWCMGFFIAVGAALFGFPWWVVLFGAVVMLYFYFSLTR